MKKITQTVRFKLMTALGLCTILIVMLGAFSAYSIEKLDNMVRDEYETALKPTRELGSIRADEIELRLQLRRLQIFQDSVKTAAALATIGRDISHIKSNWSDYYPGQVSSGEERAVADRINEQMDRVHTRTDDAVRMFESGNTSAAITVVDDQATLSDALLKDIEADIEINDRQAKDFTITSAAAASETLIVAVVLALVGVILSIAATIYLTRAILQPLKNAVGIANTIAQGKLGRPVNSTENGEFGDLLHSLRKMDEQLVAAVSQIQSSSEAVSTAAKEIASGNMDLAARTEEQAASLQQTASSMTELTETVQQTAANASTANDLAKSASDLANGGEQSVKEMVTTIDQIAASSSRISEITNVIEGIAFQTNILALNAAVEAARAGAHGQGFAVVAAEVRNLAQRSGLAAKEIKQLIAESSAVSDEGTKQAKNVNDSIVDIRSAIHNVSQIVSEIASASDEQSRGIKQVDLAVTQMDVVTQQNASLVEQASAAAKSLDEQAALLVRAASAFSLNVAYR